MKPTGSEIKKRISMPDDHAIIFEYTCSEGQLKAHYRSATGTFWIDKLYVDRNRRRNNIGRQLLQTAKLSAESLDAEYVMARITSKECLMAMSRVFGQESISVRLDGDLAHVGADYNADAPTSAGLRYRIGGDTDDLEPSDMHPTQVTTANRELEGFALSPCSNFPFTTGN